MKLTIETNLLRDALKTVSVAAESRSTLPILSHVLIEAGENVVFTATDLELRCRHSASAQVAQSGAVCPPLDLLSRLAACIQSTQTELEQQGSQLIIRGGDVVVTLDTLPAEEFPPAVDAKCVGIEMEVSGLLSPLRKLSHAMSTDTSRYQLMGINVRSTDKGTELAASNGTKLVVHSLDKNLSQEDAIIPDVFVRAFLKLQLSGVGMVSVGNGVVTVENSRTQLSGKLIEGSYPNYKQIVPKNGNNVFSCRREDLINAIATCALFTQKELPGLKLTGRGKEIEVSKPSVANARVLGTELGGQPDFTIAFNSRHMLDTLGVMEGENVRIRCSDPVSPMRIDEGALTAVLVPVTTKQV